MLYMQHVPYVLCILYVLYILYILYMQRKLYILYIPCYACVTCYTYSTCYFSKEMMDELYVIISSSGLLGRICRKTSRTAGRCWPFSYGRIDEL